MWIVTFVFHTFCKPKGGLKMIGIQSLEFYIPDNFVPTDQLSEVINLSEKEKQFFSLLQVKTISIAEGYSSVDLAVAASKQALEEANLEAGEIDMIIYLQSRTPEFLMSSEATRFQQELGATKAFSFTVTDLGCANINSALLIAKNFLNSNNSIKNILISYGSKPFGPYRYREAVTVIGDAGMGLIVSNTEKHQILDIKIKTDGTFWDLYKIDHKNKLVQDYKEMCTSPQYKFQLSITSRNVFNELKKQIFEENKIDTVQGYIMQNLSINAFVFNENALDIKLAQSCYDNCKKFGHLGDIDILLNYKTSLLNHEFGQGDLVLLMNNSPTACWSSMLVRV